jgi:hypothetical protein
MKRPGGGMPTADELMEIFASRYKLDEGGQRFLRELIGMASFEARREGYHDAVLELLDGLIHLSSKQKRYLTPEFLKDMRQNLGSSGAFREYLRRQKVEE